MSKLIGKKLKMTQIFKDEKVVPVTVVKFDDGDLSSLKEGETVRLSGTSKSKGFQGVVKRHGFHGGPKSHGQKDRHRAPGSIGSTGPQRVMPGKKMAGRMGGDKTTLKKVKIIEINVEKKEVSLKGAIPGNRNSIIHLII
ncbi:MAG: 50S ribosomal protein L3 [Patescibacteria group bacterium]